jgi:uncharacterized protein YjbI with pentapeptide repeats
MRWPAWLGVGERRWEKSPNEEVQPPKTLWDFLQLLIVPAILVVIALAFNASQASRERKREDRRIREDRALAESAREDAILDAYFAKISGLMLDRGLKGAPGPFNAFPKGRQDAAAERVRQVARTVTLETLRRLNGSRKGEVIRFLAESRLLIGKRSDFLVRVSGLPLVREGARAHVTDWSIPAIDLKGADLRGVDLRGADLVGTTSMEKDRHDYQLIQNADLRGARFDHANLVNIVFGSFGKPQEQSGITDLSGASFNDATIENASFSYSDLRRASFTKATVRYVKFDHAELNRAVFDYAFILEYTSFNSACVNNATFVGARFNTEDPEQRINLGGAAEATTFRGAKGHSVNFSYAHNLSSVRLGGGVGNPRFVGADGQPKTAKPPGPFDHANCH